MNGSEARNEAEGLNRRHFFAAAGAVAVTTLTASSVHAQAIDNSCRAKQPAMVTGNGEWTYRVVEGWGQLPAGTAFGGTHGGIATD